MGIEVRDDTLYTGAMPAGSWLIGGQTAADAAPTAFARESVLAYMQSAFASVASSGSATDLTSGTLPLGRLHSHLQDISNIFAPAQGDILYFDGANWVTLTAGAAGHVLTTGGAGANPAWGPTGAGDMYSADNLAYLADMAVSRANLGVTIGTDVQAYDAGLADIAALAVTDGNIIVGNGTNWVAESGATARASLGVAIGTNVQAWSANLDSWSAVAPSAYTTVASLAATTTGNGSALVGIEDAGSYFAGTTVESALQYLGAAVAALDQAVVLKGTWDASAGTFPGSGVAQAGWSYIVSLDGTVDSVDFVAGDRIVAIVDNASTATYASNWLQLDYTDRVSSVAGRTGAVTIAQADVSGLTTADSPQFAGINIGHATDTTLTRVSAGVVAVEGSNILLASDIGSTVQAYDAVLADLAGLSLSQGDVLYFDGANLARLAAGTAGYVLTSGGAGANPSWGAAGAGDVTAASAFAADNLLLRSDGTAKGAQASAIAVDDSGNVSGVKNVAMTGYLDVTEMATPSNPAANVARLYAYDDGGTTKIAFRDSAGTESVIGSGSNSVCDGRLTLTSGTAITTSDVTAATTIYFTPFQGDSIALHDGASAWDIVPFAELSLALGTLTSDTNYDVFVYNNSGTAAIDTLVAWTNATTRATALTLQDGVLVKTGATTRRYVGTIRTTSTTTTEDSASKRFVWNMQNRVRKNIEYLGSGTYLSTGGGGWEYFLNTSSAQVHFVLGQDSMVHLTFMALHSVSSTGTASIGVDLDGTSTGVDATLVVATNSTSSVLTSAAAVYNEFPGVGYHYLTMMEKPGASNTIFYGSLTDIQYGATGYLEA